MNPGTRHRRHLARKPAQRLGWCALAFAAASGVGAILNACALSGECTLIGCVDGLFIDVEPKYGWQAGDYRFEIDLDGELHRCEVTLPFTGCEGASHVLCTPDGKIRFSEVACIGQPEEQGFSSVEIDLPEVKQIHVKLFHNEAMIFEQSDALDYQSHQPNEGCGPVCRVSSLTWKFAAVSR